ncbi:MAG TPA: hypothetical protein VHI13_18550 [Candidatus Kapabacteria bacterium]|nr:hypothetical protein [Candidatus Kapabacteria bacterium]
MKILLVLLVIGLFITVSQALISALEWFVGLTAGTKPLGLIVLAALLMRAAFVISRRVSA